MIISHPNMNTMSHTPAAITNVDLPSKRTAGGTRYPFTPYVYIHIYTGAAATPSHTKASKYGRPLVIYLSLTHATPFQGWQCDSNIHACIYIHTLHTHCGGTLENQTRIIYMSKILLAEKSIIHAHTDLIFWVCMTFRNPYIIT